MVSDSSVKAGHSNSGFISSLDRLMKPFEDAANLIAAFAIFLLMILGCAQIVLRTVFNSPVSGYIDMVELSMAGMAFLGAAYCQRLGSHIRMEILITHLKGRWIWAFEIVGTILAMGIIGVLIWYGWEHFLRSYQLGDTTIDAEFPVWPSKLLVPIAFALWFIRLGIQLLGSIRLFKNPELEHIGIASLHDAATVAQEEVQETFGEEIDAVREKAVSETSETDKQNGGTS
jgi:TRAP-type C4-dicarboxylate transport system permease small subunit